MNISKEVKYGFNFGVLFGILANLILNICNLYEYLEPKEVFRYEYYISAKLIFLVIILLISIVSGIIYTAFNYKKEKAKFKTMDLRRNFIVKTISITIFFSIIFTILFFIPLSIMLKPSERQLEFY